MSTKSNRSAGTQHTQKGVTQGITLVDPKTGNPVNVIQGPDGKWRLAVDANVTAHVSGVEVSLTGTGSDGDNIYIVDNVNGYKLKINSDGSIDANVEIDAADGDNIGLKVQQRNNSPSDSQYNKRVTAVTGSTDTDTTSLDISLHDEDGNKYSYNNPFDVVLGQKLDTNNTVTISSINASPGSPWIGAWFQTRDNSFVAQLTILASNVASGLGGIFTFEYSETGTEIPLGIAPISETRPINDFQTVRDFPLKNAGGFFRVAFEPSRILNPGEFVFITTTQSRQYEGPFVRLANQEIEEANAAMGQTFSYGKAFDQTTGKSVNLRPFNGIHTDTQIPTSLAINEEFFGSTWIDSIQSGHYLFLLAGTSPFTTVQILWSDDGINPNGAVTNITPKVVVAGSLTYNVYLVITGTFISGRYWRTHIINGGTAQSSPVMIGIASSSHLPYQPIIGLTDNISFLASAVLTRGIIAGRTTSGSFVNVNVTPDNALITKDITQTVTQSGSLFTEGIRDDISFVFERDNGAAAVARLINNLSVNGTKTHDATEGQLVVSVPSTPGSRAFFTSDKKAVYEPGHMIRGGQTIQISALPTGNGKIEWGFGEDNPSTPNGDVYNGIGRGLDATGYYVFRKKNGSYASKIYQTNFNRDKLDGGEFSGYRLNGAPIAINLLNNMITEVGFEWYGIAPPAHYQVTPSGIPLPIHVEETTGQQVGTTVPTPSLPLFIRIQNDSTSGQALTVRSGSWRGGIFTSKVVSIAKTPDGDYIDIPAPGQVADFSTTTNLGVGGTFAPTTAKIVDGWKRISVTINSSHVSATNGVVFEFFKDLAGTQSLGTTTFTYDTANVRRTYDMELVGQSYKISYINGGTATTTFRLITQLHTSASTGSVTSVETPISGATTGQTVKSVNVGRRPDGSYSNVGITNNNSLQVSIVERPSQFTGRTHINRNIVGQTATTTIYTVTPGKTFYLYSYSVSGINTSGTAGQMAFRDNTTVKMPFVFSAQALGNSPASFGEANTLHEPIPFTTNVSLSEDAGTLTFSAWIVGYEE